ncbi:MAG: hypothetical protein EOP49_02925 [Sphingobacteriales bacterium]|nr:MAG: hypothetical protein EOP49_02925 [Sphingobacteriales bacterium]
MNLRLLACFLFLTLHAPSYAWQPTDSLARQITIGDVRISGNQKTKDHIIRREISFRKGQRLSQDSLLMLVSQSKARLLALSLFTQTDFYADTVALDTIAFNIAVRERWFIIPEISLQLADRNFNVWWTEQNRDIRRTIIGATIRHKNFRGNLENLSITAQVGYSQRFYLDYQKPYIDRKQKHGLGFSIGTSQNQETFYVTDSNKLRFIKTTDRFVISQHEAALSYHYRPGFAARHMLRIGYKQIETDDTIRKSNPEYFLNGSGVLKHIELTYRYELNKTDNWNYPLQGWKLIGQVFNRMGLEGMSYQGVGSLEVGYFKKLSKKQYGSLIFRGRMALPEKQPYVFRNALGSKYDYVRGYEYYVIDGEYSGILRLNLKHELLNTAIKNIPFRYLPQLGLRIYPKIFADAGFVQTRIPGNSFLNNRMLYSIGAGIDLFTAYDFKIRLEYAWNHLDQKGLFLHFNSE